MLGHGLWSVAAFLFPTLAIVGDDSVVVAMLLFVMETLVAASLLAVRLAASRRGRRPDDAEALRLRQVARALLVFVGPFSLACAVMLSAVAFIEAAKGGIEIDLAVFFDRAKWMALALVASAVLDSLLAPVRSIHWLETGVAWQGSRTAVLFLAVLLGWPVMLFTGTSQSFLWIFFALRLLSDLGSLRPGERERIRAQMFDGGGDPAAPGGRSAKAPPPLSAAHARHDVNQSGRPLP